MGSTSPDIGSSASFLTIPGRFRLATDPTYDCSTFRSRIGMSGHDSSASGGGSLSRVGVRQFLPQLPETIES